jgi:hypothetical protein
LIETAASDESPQLGRTATGSAETGRFGVPSAIASVACLGEKLSESPPPDGTQHPDGTQQPISAQPWPTPSGDPLATSPTYVPGAAPIPPPPDALPPDGPPTSQFAPVNYAPPGYAPDYGHGHQYPPPPPGYGGGYPGPYAPPPRRSNAPLIAVVIAVALLLCGGVTTAGILIAHNVKAKANEALKPLTDPTQPDPAQPEPTQPDPAQPDPTLPDLPGGGFPTDTGKQIQVTYEVTGDGPAEIIYLPKLGASPTRVDDVKLPWRFTATMETPALLSVIGLRADSDDGSITCRALVDGKEVKKTSAGPNGFATAACTYFALD